MVTLLTVIHITVCLFLILVVLLQAGKGGGMGIAFGGAGSQTVFGSSGAGNFLTRLTSITAAVFLLTSLALAHYSSRQDSKRLQELASEKAAEKKAEDEKAAKLKLDMEKIRAEAAGKNSNIGGAAGTATSASPAGTDSTTPPLQLKMPGTAPVRPTGTTPPVPAPSAPSKVQVPPKPTSTGAAPATKKPEGVEPAAAPATGGPAGTESGAKPAVKRRKPVTVAPAGAPVESPPPPPVSAPAPAAPAE